VAFGYARTGLPYGQHYPLFTPEGHDPSDIHTSDANACRSGLPDFNHHLRSLKNKARELLHSEEGIAHRKRRCCEPEPVFSHIRYDGQYLRFRHFGQDNVEMDFAIFAITINIGKMHRKRVHTSKNPKNDQKSAQNPKIFVICRFFIPQTTSNENFPLKFAT
jgi:hypothetical protein